MVHQKAVARFRPRATAARLRPSAVRLLAMAVALVMALVAAGTPAPARAEGALYLAALDRLTYWGILSGQGEGRFADRLTRGELAKLAAVAAGLEAEARARAGELPFADLRGHWAAGYVAAARDAGLVNGYPDDTFRPNQEVTYVQLLAVLLRLTGRDPGPNVPWPDGVVEAALAAGLVPPELPVADYATVPAVRAPAFVLADAAFVHLRDDQGRNLYQRVFGARPPRLLISPGVTRETADESFQLLGVVEHARAAFLDGQPLLLDERGIFNLAVPLEVGVNRFELTAEGWEGSLATLEWVVVRQPGPLAEQP